MFRNCIHAHSANGADGGHGWGGGGGGGGGGGYGGAPPPPGFRFALTSDYLLI